MVDALRFTKRPLYMRLDHLTANGICADADKFIRRLCHIRLDHLCTYGIGVKWDKFVHISIGVSSRQKRIHIPNHLATWDTTSK